MGENLVKTEGQLHTPQKSCSLQQKDDDATTLGYLWLDCFIKVVPSCIAKT